MMCCAKVGLLDRVTHAVSDNSCDVTISRVSDRRMIRPKKVRPKIIRPKIIRPMDAIGLANDSVLRDDPSEESLSEDNTTDGCDWLSRRFRLKVRPKDAPKPFDWLC